MQLPSQLGQSPSLPAPTSLPSLVGATNYAVNVGDIRLWAPGLDIAGAIARADAAVQLAGGGQVEIPAGTWTLATSVAVASPIRFVGVVRCAAGVALTINYQIVMTSLQKHFDISAAGSVVAISPIFNDWLYPEWWGVHGVQNETINDDANAVANGLAVRRCAAQLNGNGFWVSSMYTCDSTAWPLVSFTIAGNGGSSSGGFKLPTTAAPGSSTLNLQGNIGPNIQLRDFQIAGKGSLDEIGLDCRQSNGIVAQNIWLRGLGTAVYIQGSNIEMSQCFYEYCTTCILFDTNDCKGNAITDGFFYQSAFGIVVNGAIDVTGLVISNPGFVGMGIHLLPGNGACILVNGASHGGRIVNASHEFDNSGNETNADGIRFTGGCTNWTVSGFTNNKCGNIGINLDNCSEITITDVDIVGGSLALPNIGILTSNASSNIRINGYRINGLATGLRHGSTGSRCIFRDGNIVSCGTGLIVTSGAVGSAPAFYDLEINGSTVADFDTLGNAIPEIEAFRVLLAGGYALFRSDLAGTAGKVNKIFYRDFVGRKVCFGDIVPTAGTSAVGDTVERATPVVGQFKRLRSTVAGTPGTWVSEGNL